MGLGAACRKRSEGRKGRGLAKCTGREILANTINLPVALRILAHLHGEINPQWHDLAQVVNVETKKAANLSKARLKCMSSRRPLVRLVG